MEHLLQLQCRNIANAKGWFFGGSEDLVFLYIELTTEFLYHKVVHIFLEIESVYKMGCLMVYPGARESADVVVVWLM